MFPLAHPEGLANLATPLALPPLQVDSSLLTGHTWQLVGQHLALTKALPSFSSLSRYSSTFCVFRGVSAVSLLRPLSPPSISNPNQPIKRKPMLWLPGCLVAWLPGCLEGSWWPGRFLVAWWPGRFLVAWWPGRLLVAWWPGRLLVAWWPAWLVACVAWVFPQQSFTKKTKICRDSRQHPEHFPASPLGSRPGPSPSPWTAKMRPGATPQARARGACAPYPGARASSPAWGRRSAAARAAS